VSSAPAGFKSARAVASHCRGTGGIFITTAVGLAFTTCGPAVADRDDEGEPRKTGSTGVALAGPFEYPVDGQVIDYEGDYLLKAALISGVTEHLVGMFRGGGAVDPRRMSGCGVVARVKKAPAAITQGETSVEARRRIREVLGLALDDVRPPARTAVWSTTAEGFTPNLIKWDATVKQSGSGAHPCGQNSISAVHMESHLPQGWRLHCRQCHSHSPGFLQRHVSF
jgi:hypothetical protein